MLPRNNQIDLAIARLPSNSAFIVNTSVTRNANARAIAQRF